jgi:hypothetical protein
LISDGSSLLSASILKFRKALFVQSKLHAMPRAPLLGELSEKLTEGFNPFPDGEV